MNRPMRLSLLPLSLLVACGGTTTSGSAFSPSYPDNRPAAVEAVAADVSVANPPPSIDVGVAITADGLIGFTPSTGAEVFRSATSTTLPVVVAGEHALVESSGSIRVLALANGSERTRVELGSGEHLVGAGAGGPNLAFTILRGTGSSAHSRLVLVANGSVTEDVELDRPAGVPAIAANRVLVPWAYQNLSVLDLDGDEVARIRLRGGVIGHAIADRGRVWFGATTLYRFDRSSANDSPTGYSLPDLRIERPPTLLPNAYEPAAPISSAAYKVRLAFAVDPASESGAPADGNVYLVHYRFVFALDAGSGAVRWVRVLPSDVVGVRASVGGVRVAAETGELMSLRASDGRAISLGSIGARVLSVAFPQLSTFPTTDPVETDLPDVRAQLFRAVETADARLVTAREYALARLADLPDDDATSDLGALCEDARLPARTRTKACDLLATRATGASHVQAQLRRRGSFLAEEPHPPVAALARAAASMNDRASVPLLVEQLADPRTDIHAIPAIANALVTLEATDSIPALAAFVRTYHADPSEEGILDAIGAVAEAYGRLGGEPALNEIGTLSHDPLTTGPLINALRDAARRVRQASAPTPTTTGPNRTPTAPPPPAIPGHITMEMAAPVLDPVRADLAACLGADPTHPGSVRVILMIRRDGSVADVHAAPAGPSSCLNERLRPLRFPETRGPGETVRFTTTIRAR